MDWKCAIPEICYIDKRFNSNSSYIIGQARAVCSSYAQQGYDLTLRQLYYQFVARDLFPDDWTWAWTGAKWVKDPAGTKNADPNYKRLGSIVNDARLAGVLDWDYIVDRTRKLEGPGTRDMPHWSGPDEIIRAAARSFRIDKWADQEYRVEAWIEKDALKGVLEQACPELDIAFFSCRGYASQSEIWGAAQRLGDYIDRGQKVVILHLGDHDPSGIDMTRDINERLATFIAQDRLGAPDGLEIGDYLDTVDEGDSLEVKRIALNMDQVQRYNPPPNPAKLTDARARGYIERYGDSSWELDALDPATLVALVQEGVAEYRDDGLWEEALEHERSENEILTATHERWGEVKSFLNGER